MTKQTVINGAKIVAQVSWLMIGVLLLSAVIYGDWSALAIDRLPISVVEGMAVNVDPAVTHALGVAEGARQVVFASFCGFASALCLFGGLGMLRRPGFWTAANKQH